MVHIIDCGAKTLPRDIDVNIQLSKAQTELSTDLSVMVFVSASGDLPAGAGRIRYYTSPDALFADWPPGTQAYLAGHPGLPGRAGFLCPEPTGQDYGCGPGLQRAATGLPAHRGH